MLKIATDPKGSQRYPVHCHIEVKKPENINIEEAGIGEF